MAGRLYRHGQVIRGEHLRRAGIHANAAMWGDPSIKNTCMFDPVGGSVSSYNTHVRLEPIRFVKPDPTVSLLNQETLDLQLASFSREQDADDPRFLRTAKSTDRQRDPVDVLFFNPR